MLCVAALLSRPNGLDSCSWCCVMVFVPGLEVRVEGRRQGRGYLPRSEAGLVRKGRACSYSKEKGLAGVALAHSERRHMQTYCAHFSDGLHLPWQSGISSDIPRGKQDGRSQESNAHESFDKVVPYGRQVSSPATDWLVMGVGVSRCDSEGQQYPSTH